MVVDLASCVCTGYGDIGDNFTCETACALFLVTDLLVYVYYITKVAVDHTYLVCSIIVATFSRGYEQEYFVE